MTRKSFVLTIGIVCVLGGAGYFAFQQNGGTVSFAFQQNGGGWKEYTYPDDGYAISAPSKPIPAPSEEEPDSRGYSINYDNRTVVAFAAPPFSMWGDLSPTEKLQRIEEMEVKGTGGKLVSEKQISLGGNPGIELELEFPDSHNHSRWYVVNGKVLYLYSSAPAGAPLAPDTDRILIRFGCCDSTK